MLSDVMEDYLKAIYVLQSESGERVSTSALADRLDVTSPTVTSMLDKLAERGLVDREKYKGVRLTPEGETVAIEILRHHRLIESFLADALDYDWTDVHDEADRLEHHISERFESRIAEALDHPPTDPHGDPIPDADLAPPEDAPGYPLAEATVGETVVVQRVRHRTDEELAYLAGVGVEPGAELDVAEVAPFGMVTVEGPAGRQSLPAEVARVIRVGPADEVEPADIQDAPFPADPEPEPDDGDDGERDVEEPPPE
jgi:DtxR family Mn-dependent transcriptional regulator